jgi:hypothetical protein
VDQFFSRFTSIPLDVTCESGAVVDYGEQLGREPSALEAENFPRAVVVVQVPKRVDVFGFEAPDFPSLE